MVSLNLILAYMGVMFVLYVGTVIFMWMKLISFMRLTMAYIKAPTAAEAEAAVRPPTPPPAPPISEEERLRALQRSHYDEK